MSQDFTRLQRLLTSRFYNFTRVVELVVFVDITLINLFDRAIYLKKVYLKATLVVNSMPIATIPVILVLFKTILIHEESICIRVYHLIRIALINRCFIRIETVKLRLYIFVICVSNSLVEGSKSKGRRRDLSIEIFLIWIVNEVILISKYIIFLSDTLEILRIIVLD